MPMAYDAFCPFCKAPAEFVTNDYIYIVHVMGDDLHPAYLVFCTLDQVNSVVQQAPRRSVIHQAVPGQVKVPTSTPCPTCEAQGKAITGLIILDADTMKIASEDDKPIIYN